MKRSIPKKALRGAVVVAAMMMGLPTHAQEQATPGDKWQFEVTPYLFGSALSGTTGVGGVTADVDASFGDIMDNFDSGFMMMLEARKGKWGFGFDGVYFKLENQKTSSWQGPGGIGSATGELEASMTQQIYQLAGMYRFSDAAVKIDAIAAARYTQLDTDLNLVTTTAGLLPGGTRSLSASQSWWDPVIGIRVLAPFAEHWTFLGYADIGGFGVGSDVTYQAIAGVNWQVSEMFAAKAGYRYFYQDYEDGAFIWDMAAHGFYLGLGIRF
jgi:opacity protein-like surface antigen